MRTVATATVVVLICVGIIWFVNGQRRTLESVDEIEVKGVYLAWIEAGRPNGKALNEFLTGRRKDIVVLNTVIPFQGSNVHALLCVTNTYGRQTLVVCTNGLLFRLSAVN